jgi:hypothetical protein
VTCDISTHSRRVNLYQAGMMPSTEELHNYIFDLLPPATLFCQENKRFLLTYGGWR